MLLQWPIPPWKTAWFLIAFICLQNTTKLLDTFSSFWIHSQPDRAKLVQAGSSLPMKLKGSTYLERSSQNECKLIIEQTPSTKKQKSKINQQRMSKPSEELTRRLGGKPSFPLRGEAWVCTLSGTYWPRLLPILQFSLTTRGRTRQLIKMIPTNFE